MSPIEIRNRMHEKPFEAFTLHMSDGSSYDVPHPDFAFVRRTRVSVVVEVGMDQVPEKWLNLIRCTLLE